jgi:hypothetical protein
MTHIAKAVIEPVEPRRLFAATLIQDGSPATLVDADGSSVLIRMEGPGTLSADLSSGKLALAATDTSMETQLWVDVTGGDGAALLGKVSFPTDIGGIHAPDVKIRGRFSARIIGQLEVGDIRGSTLNVVAINDLSCAAVSNSLMGGDRLGNVEIAGAVAGSRVYAMPADDKRIAITSLSVGGTVSDSTIYALGDISTISLGSLIRSNLTAGVRFSETSTNQRLIQPIPAKVDGNQLHDFTGKYGISNITITGIGAAQSSMVDSVIGAYQIGTVNIARLGAIDRAGGIGAYSIKKIKTDGSQSVEAIMNSSFVQQIRGPLRYDPVTDAISGDVSGSNSSIGLIKHGTGSIIIGGGQTAEPIPTEGIKLGTVVTGGVGKLIHLTQAGRFQIRGKSGKSLAAFSRVEDLVASVFSSFDTSIKVEDVAGTSSVRLMATSTGPVVTLLRANLDKYFVIPAGFCGIPSPKGWSNVEVFSRPIAFITNKPLQLGSIISIFGVTPIEVTTSLQYKVGDETGSALIPLAYRARQIGRRLGPMGLAESGKLIVYGLESGETTVITGHLGQIFLNRKGDTLTGPYLVQIDRGTVEITDSIHGFLVAT